MDATPLSGFVASLVDEIAFPAFHSTSVCLSTTNFSFKLND